MGRYRHVPGAADINGKSGSSESVSDSGQSGGAVLICWYVSDTFGVRAVNVDRRILRGTHCHGVADIPT